MVEKATGNVLDALMEYLPPKISRLLPPFFTIKERQITEVRLRLNRPVFLGYGNQKMPLKDAVGQDVVLTEDDMKTAVYRITQGSVYALEEELRRGYITLKGGHRVGIGGRVLLEGGKVHTIRDISSLNYRVAHAVRGCSERLYPYVCRDNKVLNTLIFSPPCAGKTTLLRDLAALFSDQGKNVALVDERSEIAGCFLGHPQLWVGSSTDILDGAPKTEGMMMAIRSLSPEILVTDEIGGAEEEIPILEAVNSGISLLLTAHAETMEELQKRPLLHSLLEKGVFQCFICLSAKPYPGAVKGIYDGKGMLLK